MPYTKTDWDETTAITDTRLNNQENGIADVEDYVDAQVAIANANILNAKTPLASAITNKGIPTSSSDTFTQMAINIGLIKGIKSIQSGYIDPSNYGNVSWQTHDITINNINTSKSIIIAKKDHRLSVGRGCDWRWDFTSSTNVRVTKYQNNADYCWYGYYVVEFEDYINVQKGTVYADDAVTITSVNTNLSFAVCSNTSISSATGGITVIPHITSSTNLNLYRGDTLGVYTTWFVVDFSQT